MEWRGLPAVRADHALPFGLAHILYGPTSHRKKYISSIAVYPMHPNKGLIYKKTIFEEKSNNKLNFLFTNNKLNF